IVADQMAHTIDNARLYDQNEKHKEILIKQIVARKNAELVVKESEEKFRGLAEQSLTGIYIIEGDYFKYVNPYFAQIFGYSTNELLGNFRAVDTVYEADREMVRDTVYKRLNGEPVKSNYGFRGVKKDGSVIHVEVFGKAAKVGNNLITIGTLLDVTDRIQSAELIQESEKKYRSLIEQASDPILLYSFDGTIHEFNTSAWSISGYTKKEFASLKLEDILVGDVILNQDKYAAQLRKESVSIARKLKKKDGSILEMEINAKMLADGKMLAFARDVTERKKAENAVRQSEYRTRKIFESNMIGFTIWDANGDIIDGNEYFLKMVGYTRQEVADNKVRWSDMTPPEYAEADRNSRRELVESGVSQLYEKEFLHKDGRRIPILIGVALLEEGNVEKGISYIIDLTERKKAERAIEESEIKFHSLVEQAGDGIFIANRELRYIEVNNMACSMLGYTKAELLKLSIKELVSLSPGDIPLRFAEVLSGESILQERNLLKKDGTLIPVEINTSPMENGNIMSIIRDITERKRAEKELATSENYLRSILETEPECVKVLNSKGELLSMNPAGLTMVEADNEQEVLNHRMVDLVDQKYRLAFNRLTKNVFNGTAGTLEFEVTGLKGGHRWLETHAVPMKDVEGNIISLLGVTRDITQRKKAEEAKIDREAQLQMMNDNLPDTMVYQVIRNQDGKMKFTYLSKSVQRLTGKSPEEIIENPYLLYKLYHKDDVAMLTAAETASFESMMPFNVEVRGYNAAGELHHFNIRAVPRKQLDGSTIWDGLHTDITVQKKAEGERQFLLSRNQQTLTNMMEGYVLVNHRGNILEVNPSFCQMVGHSREELLQTESNKLTAILNQKEIEEKIAETNEKQSLQFETKLWKKDKNIIDVDVSLSIVTFDDQQLVAAFVRDITDKKKAEALIRQSEEKFKAAFYASPDSISITSIKTGKLIEVNSGFTETFGFSREEAIAKSAVELGINRNLPNRNEIEKYFEGGGMVQNAEGILYTKANDARACLSSVVKLDWGNEACLLSIIKDVTESKRAQQEIVSMNKQLRDLSTHLQNIREEERANISREIHDELGQQLTGLRMDASWLNKKMKPREKVTGERIEGMIGLIDITIKTVRRISTELRPGILDDLGLLAALDWQSQEFEKRTEIKTTFHSNVTELHLEKSTTSGIFRVYQESLTNVARHSGAQKVETFLSFSDNLILLTIHDNGKGINEVDISERKTLGIVGMKERALMMGGEFQINGIPGKGTTVTLRIPVPAIVPD
ncbi:MAG: PAS domain S-box protein, partial [Bacteroidia bacterium]|nr:PAS domain S-box protein [Bacteroidia bacterium]